MLIVMFGEAGVSGESGVKIFFSFLCFLGVWTDVVLIFVPAVADYRTN